MSNSLLGIACLCGLAFAQSALVDARAAEPEPSRVAAAQETTCSCKVCTPDACCKAPTGFQPLDEKCASKCETRTWTVTPPDSCGTQAGCCQ